MIAAALLASAAPSTAPLAVQSVPADEPSAVALSLAEALIDTEITPAAVDTVASGLSSQLLNSLSAARGRSCDHKVPACRQAAERLAREEAPVVLSQRRAVRVQMQAVLIDETMTAAQIAEAGAFVRTPAGKALSHALLRDGAALSPAVQQKLGRILMRPAKPTGRRSLLDRFYDATAGLPRGSLPMAPPPPLLPRAPQAASDTSLSKGMQ